MITMMIVMDCLHFANYFVPLIYNSGALTISAESRAAANCILQKSIAAVLILQTHKRLDSPHQLGHIALNTNRMMQCRGLTWPYRAASSTPTILSETNGNVSAQWEAQEFLVQRVWVAFGVVRIHTVNRRCKLCCLPAGSPPPFWKQVSKTWWIIT